MTSEGSSLDYEIGSIRQGLADVKATLSKMADVLERMARLEERHASTSNALDRVYTSISGIESRLAKIEQQMPEQKLATGWVINAVWASAGVVAAMVLKHLGII